MDTTIEKSHPIHYTVFQPNILVKAESDMKLMERRLYTEILTFNHKDNPDEHTYYIPYENITQSAGRDAKKHFKRDYHRIAESLQARVLRLDAEFVKTHFGEESPASISPFPRIHYEKQGFRVVLEEWFKIILTRLDLGFTKGDIQLLRSFKHTHSYHMYWLIRYNQWRNSSLTLEINKLKEAVGCANKYNDFYNFKRKVLNPIQKEFRGTWVEFEYALVRKGRGAPVTAITLNFKTDGQQERTLGLGEVYNFEKILESYGISPQEIKKIRQYVTLEEDVRPGFSWNEHYVESVIELVKEQYRAKRKNPAATPIRDMGAYILVALKSGFFVDIIVAMKQQISQQLDVFADTPNKDDSSEKSEPFRTSYESFQEMYELHKSVHQIEISETDYATSIGYRVEGNEVVKIVR